MNIQTRKAQKKDMQSVYNFLCELEECVFDFNCFKSLYENNIRDVNCIYLVAELENKTVIGFVSCHIQYLLHHCGKVAEIQELFVDSTFRNKGVGKQLIAHLNTLLSKKIIVSFEVTANIKRTGTHRFYEQQGYVYTHKKFVKNN